MGKQKLTRKELVKHIEQTMPSDLNEYEKLAFIEVEVAKQISFNEQYFWGDSATRKKIYKLAKEEAQRPEQGIKRNLICINMSELFGYVAKQFGFDVRYQRRAPCYEIQTGNEEIFTTITPETKEHVCPVIGLSNGQFIEVDIQDDLARLQTRSKPQAFGKHRHGTRADNGVKIDIIDNSLCEMIFGKIYELELNEKFTDEHIMALAAKLRHQGKTPIEMFEIFIEDPKIKKELQNTRGVEANDLYKTILSVCYDFNLEKQFFKKDSRAILEECILRDSKGQKRYSFCLYAEDLEEKVFFVYSKSSKRMVKLSLEELEQLSQNSINIQLRGRSSELRQRMISFIKSSPKDMEKLKEPTQVLSLEDIFFDDDER